MKDEKFAAVSRNTVTKKCIGRSQRRSSAQEKQCVAIKISDTSDEHVNAECDYDASGKGVASKRLSRAQYADGPEAKIEVGNAEGNSKYAELTSKFGESETSSHCVQGFAVVHFSNYPGQRKIERVDSKLLESQSPAMRQSQ